MARVLLVDDDPGIRETAAMRLRGNGHRVIAVPDARSAVDAVDAANLAGSDASRAGGEAGFDVAVLDVEAPGVDDSVLSSLLQPRELSAMLPIVFYVGDPTGQGLASDPASAGDDQEANSGMVRLLETIESLARSPRS